MVISSEAQAVALAVILGPALLFFHVVLYRQRNGASTSNADLFVAYVLYAFAWGICAFVLWRSQITLGQLLAGLSTVGFICLAYMQVFSQVCRGFSLRILVDIERCGGLDLEGILLEYSDGRGAHWLLDKRITGLESAGMIIQDKSNIRLVEPRGRQAGRAGILLKQILKPGQGG